MSSSRFSLVSAAIRSSANPSIAGPSATSFQASPSRTNARLQTDVDRIVRGDPPGTRDGMVRSRTADTRTRTRSPAGRTATTAISEYLSSPDSNTTFNCSSVGRLTVLLH